MSRLILFLVLFQASPVFASSFFRSFFPKSFSAEFNGALLYNAHDFSTGTELAVLRDNKVEKFDLYPGMNSSSPREFTVVDNKLFFVARHPQLGYELWSYTHEDGPQLYKDIFEGASDSFPAYLTACDNKLYFTADFKEEGRELAVLDPNNGKIRVIDFVKGSASSYPVKLTCFKNKLFFSIRHVIDQYGVYSVGANDEVVLEYKLPNADKMGEMTVMNDTLFLSFTGDLYAYEKSEVVKLKDFFNYSFYGLKIRIGSYALSIGDDIFSYGDESTIMTVNASTGKIGVLANPENLKFKSIFKVLKVGNIGFFQTRDLDSYRLIYMYMKDMTLRKYTGASAPADLILYNGKFYSRSSILSSDLTEYNFL